MTQQPTIGDRLRAWRYTYNVPPHSICERLLISHMQLEYIEDDTADMGPVLIADIEEMISAPARPTPTEDALLTLLRTAATGGWEIVIRRGCVDDGPHIVARIEEEPREHPQR